MTISVCTVILDSKSSSLETFVRSLERSSNLISEVVAIDIAARSEVTIKSARFPVRVLPRPDVPLRHYYGHAYGLHEALGASTGEYVLFSDNDVFYYLDAFDRLYFDLYERHGLAFLGISFPKDYAPFRRFPVVTNLFFKRVAFPPASYLEAQLDAMDASEPLCLPRTSTGYALFPVLIPGTRKRFPNPTGSFDTSPGMNLYLWNEETHGRWMAFQPSRRQAQSFEYSTKAVANFKCRNLIPSPPARLLFHQGKIFGGTGFTDGREVLADRRMQLFREAFERHCNEADRTRIDR